MVEPVPPPIEGNPDVPLGDAQYAHFAGILEGKRTPADASELGRLVQELNQLGLVHADLDLEGGRFTVMLSEDELPGARWRDADHDGLIAAFQSLVDASAAPEAVESTLRCTEVYDEEVIETLFAPVRGEMQCVSRTRPIQDVDRRQARASEQSELSTVGGKRAAILASLLLLVFAVLAWSGGWIDRAFGTDAEQLSIENGPFAELISLTAEASWGDYRLELVRGTDYPLTTPELEAQLANAPTPADRAAVSAVGDGSSIFARLIDEQGRVLDAVELRLRPLLSDESAVIEARLSGHMGAHTILLALDPGTRAP